MNTLLRDLIPIPEQVYKGDFVLRLTEGVERAEQTIDSYVVTPELALNFDEALGFLRSAVEERSSKATYLDGSFGSGKSHFMAVLDLLLSGYPKARAVPELAQVVAKHDKWMGGKKFLLVPYHMIGAKSLESAVLGRFVEHVKKLHPEAPTPGVYIAESLFRDAQNLRDRMGDESFFAELNAVQRAESGWGNVEEPWDARRFEDAVVAPSGSELRTRLVGDLVDGLLTSYAAAMKGQGEAYIPLDQGLSVISRHARDLGYDCVVLFLDELILWLASHAADMDFVRREIQKVAQLVEAQQSDRPLPVVSIVARQRDLRQLIGEHVPGSEQLAFTDMLGWWEGRLHKIGLMDRNLPTIAEKRLLRPRSEAARRQIDAAFEDLMRGRREVVETLLTTQADRDMFRKVYPFSPALVSTLVAVSSLLQRERTALKVMLQILVNQRDTLRLGDLVPVGDLFDIIAEGDEAFSEDMRLHFDNVKRLYHQKLQPLLLAAHKMGPDEIRALPREDARAVAFRVDDRLAKTLLLSALAPEVEPLRNLTAPRLAALNHGSIASPVPGREGQMVLTKLRTWAAEVGEIKIGDEPTNPTIALQVSSVDTESILQKAQVVDNPGERVRKVREILFRGLGIADHDQLFLVHEFLWRNTRRECEVIFKNISTLPLDSLRAREERWKVIIDLPFDHEHFSSADDLAKLQEFRDSGQPPSRTLCWIPAFLSHKSLKDLGTLVILEHVLAGDRFNDYASHLSATDRLSARNLLANRRSQLHERIRQALEGAYGVSKPPPDTVDESIELGDRVQSLDPTFRPQPPVGPDLGGAFLNLLEQALDHQYPAHPRFGTEIKLPVLKKVEEALQGQGDDPHRIFVDKTLRPLVHQVAVPLGLGEMGETHFVPGDFWKNHFLRKKAQDGGALTVEMMRRWTDDPEPRGLQSWVQNLLILWFAERENHRFLLHGGPPGPTSLDSLRDELHLEPIHLPSAEDWKAAGERIAAIFGIPAPALCSANSAARLADGVRAEAVGLRDACRRLAAALRERMELRGIDGSGSARVRTALATQALVEDIVASPPEEVIAVVARARVATSATAMGTSFRQAGAVVSTLENVNWRILESIERLSDARVAAAAEIRRRVDEALGADEYAMALQPILKRAQEDATDLLAPPEAAPAPAAETAVTRAAETISAPAAVASEGRESGLDLERARRLFRALEKRLGDEAAATLALEWKIGRGGRKA
jgi:hypothetical protein